jgi:hypothetical protein
MNLDNEPKRKKPILAPLYIIKEEKLIFDIDRICNLFWSN